MPDVLFSSKIQNPFSLSIFFPTYNEESNISESVKKVEQVVQQLTHTYEIIIVDDGSTDSTALISDALATSNEKIKVIHHSSNQGYGASVWSGIQSAQYEYVFFTDADLQFDVRELVAFYRELPHHDIILGYRAERKDPLMRKVNAFCWNVLMRFLFGLNVKDIDCAFKLMKRELVYGLPMKTRGAMMSAELLIRLQRLGISFKEIPVTHLPRTKGSPTGARPSVIFRALKEAFQLFGSPFGETVRKQLGKFALVGLINTAIDIGLYFTMTRSGLYFAEHVFLAKSLSFLAGTVFSFTFNRLWTFQSQQTFTFSEVIKFYAVVGSALCINVTGLYVFHRLVGFPDTIAVIFATGASFLWNFIISKLWVFADTSQKKKYYTVIQS